MPWDWIISGALVAVAIIHFLPVVGALGSDQLHKLYWLDASDPNLLILMRHRAAMFEVVGILMVVGAVMPSFRWMAIGLGALSAGSFVVISRLVGGFSPSLARIVTADIVALVLLPLAAVGTAVS
ncbi:MAG: hypothetical protein ACI8PZ_007520 [Myxococcota bacterium]|jgi:hypothetical protein